ncbi:hypothetical protein [Paenirhodobacter populi]|uniref:hypothetical protein n=1 Tax=Paenirhodobacter populi TaxID=2306993 RepID=UPI000FE3F1F6|nr:hypothetical protein [Sinirhodobacter populi]RWR09075.1 hypothetical protein D2T32_07495 [Sinirhodobacter populi]
MGRGLLAGLGAGGVVSVLGLGVLSVLAPLPPESVANRPRDPAPRAAGTVEQEVPRAAPRPLAVPESAPAAVAVPERAAPETPAPVEVPHTPELALPQVPQTDPMGAEPATPRAASPLAQTQPASPVVAPLDDSAPPAPAAEVAEHALSTPDRPVQVEEPAGAAPASETEPAARPGEIAAPAIPAAPAVATEDSRPAAEAAIPVPPPGEARAPDLFPAAGAGQSLRLPGGEILLVPGASVGPVRALASPQPDAAGSVAP